MIKTRIKTRIESASSGKPFSIIAIEQLGKIYTTMLACRAMSPGAASATRQGDQLRGLRGSEAVAVGACIQLGAGDLIHSPWPDSVLRAINPILSLELSLPAALRWAEANRHSGKALFAFSYCKSSPTQIWSRAIDLAAERKLPILFVPISPWQRPPASIERLSLSTRTVGAGLPSIVVDGHDAVAVYRVATEAVNHARKGHGPSLIHCKIPENGDPLTNMRDYLRAKGLLD